jgi:hypothetical protein
MVRNNTKIFAGISITICMVCVFVSAGFLYVITKQKTHYTEMSTESARIKANQSSLDELIHTLDETTDARATLATSILTEEKVIDFLALIESIGTEQGVALTTNSLTIEPIDTTFETVVITVGVKGQYAAILHVLKLLEQIPYSSSVRNVQMQSADIEHADKWEGVFEMRVIKFVKK